MTEWARNRMDGSLTPSFTLDAIHGLSAGRAGREGSKGMLTSCSRALSEVVPQPILKNADTHANALLGDGTSCGKHW